MTTPDAIQLKIKDRLINNIRPNTLGLFDIFTEKRADKTIVVVNLAGGTSTPYYIRTYGRSEKGCYLRIGTSAQPMTEQLIEDTIARRQKISLATTLSPNQRLTFEQLKIYYQEHGLLLNDKFADTLDMRLATGEYNYLAYLLADQNGASLRFAKYKGTDKTALAEYEEYGYRCLITATHRLLDRLTAENKTYAKITYPFRVEKNMVDKSALREAVINAIVHNDYSLAEPAVEMFDDRITVTSAGGLVRDMSREEFFAGRSLPRNRELMRVFRDVELVERLGSGMKRMLGAYDRTIFDFSPSFLVVTLPVEKESDTTNAEGKSDGSEKSSVESSVQSSVESRVESRVENEVERESEAESKVESRVKDPEKSSSIRTSSVENEAESGIENKEKGSSVKSKVESKVEILQLMEANPTITAQEIAEALGLSLSSIEKSIRKLRESGMIHRVGPNKGGHWKI